MLKMRDCHDRRDQEDRQFDRPHPVEGYAARLNLKEGDKLYRSSSRTGASLSPYDPDFEKAMEIARRGMKRYHNALAELAK